MKIEDEYWKISVEESIGELDINLTDDQIILLSNDMYLSSQMESEAKGYHFIPDPVEEENNQTILTLKKQIQELEFNLGCYVSSVAKRRNCEVTDVYLDYSGNVMIHP